MQVEVVYALPNRQAVVNLELCDGATVADALAAVSDTPPFCDLDLSEASIGIYGELTATGTVLHAGDRVEIYRPLKRSPMQARRLRAGSGPVDDRGGDSNEE
ncbi:MAG: RnfH family protein [Pseudomonadales bacterium]|jgi:putative ubiquitin-RnfH superfamily antitoxin RatB of RatAB toxin-antitoxin module